MPTNANTFNSRVTSEALEKKFRDTFPSQGGAELVQDLFASGVIVPVVDFTSTAEGSALRSDLQQAWDFSTGSATATVAGTTTVISNTGFWKVDLTATGYAVAGLAGSAILQINDGSSTKKVWGITTTTSGSQVEGATALEEQLIIFLRSGDSLELVLNQSNYWRVDVWYRQIADVYGNLNNPLGYTSS